MRQLPETRTLHCPRRSPGSAMSWADCAAARSVKIRRIRRVRRCGTSRASSRSASRCSPYVRAPNAAAQLCRRGTPCCKSCGLKPIAGRCPQIVRSVCCFHVEIITLTGYDNHSASGFQETSFGFLGFPERLGGQWRAEPLSLPVLGELKIHTSGHTPCRYDTPKFSSFHKWINSLQYGRWAAYV